MIDLEKLIGKNVTVKIRNVDQVLEDSGVLISVDDKFIEIEYEGTSFLDEYGSNMGGAHKIDRELVISVEETSYDN